MLIAAVTANVAKLTTRNATALPINSIRGGGGATASVYCVASSSCSGTNSVSCSCGISYGSSSSACDHASCGSERPSIDVAAPADDAGASCVDSAAAAATGPSCVASPAAGATCVGGPNTGGAANAAVFAAPRASAKLALGGTSTGVVARISVATDSRSERCPTSITRTGASPPCARSSTATHAAAAPAEPMGTESSSAVVDSSDPTFVSVTVSSPASSKAASMPVLRTRAVAASSSETTSTLSTP